MIDSSLKILSTSLAHPRLIKTDAEFISIFLHLYDQYAAGVAKSSYQLFDEGTVTIEAVRPSHIKFFVDPEYLESSLAFGFIDGEKYYKGLSEPCLRMFLESQDKEIIVPFWTLRISLIC